MIYLNETECKFLIDILSKGKLTVEKEVMSNKLRGSTKIIFYYINHADEYKFRTHKVLTTGCIRKNTYYVNQDDFNRCLYIDLGIRKTDCLNVDFIKGLKLARFMENERQSKMDAIKAEV